MPMCNLGPLSDIKSVQPKKCWQTLSSGSAPLVPVQCHNPPSHDLAPQSAHASPMYQQYYHNVLPKHCCNSTIDALIGKGGDACLLALTTRRQPALSLLTRTISTAASSISQRISRFELNLRQIWRRQQVDVDHLAVYGHQETRNHPRR